MLGFARVRIKISEGPQYLGFPPMAHKKKKSHFWGWGLLRPKWVHNYSEVKNNTIRHFTDPAVFVSATNSPPLIAWG